MSKMKFEHITWNEYQECTKNPDPAIKAECELIKKIMDNRKK